MVGEGTGMGLAVVYGIVKDLGGEIKARSELGKGTVFDIYLPVMKNYQVDGGEKNETSVFEGGNERILFVDDEPLIADMNNDLLGDFGYKVKSITSSHEALKLFRLEPEKYDLLITDMTMPNMTGIGLTEEIHKIRSDLPVIICTGFSDNINDDNFRSMGVSALVMKPVDLNEILDTIRRVLRKKERN